MLLRVVEIRNFYANVLIMFTKPQWTIVFSSLKSQSTVKLGEVFGLNTVNTDLKRHCPRAGLSLFIDTD